MESIGTLIIIWIGSKLVISDTISLGELVAFESLTTFFIIPVKNIIKSFGEFQNTLVSIGRVTDILEIEKEYSDSKSNKSFTKQIKTVQLKNVDYQYNLVNKSLDNIDITINTGSIIGITGTNGSGKTTIFKTILGLVKKESGEIKINGKSIDGKSKDYLNSIGTIIEYPTFYESLTARQNLMLISSLYDEVNLSKEDLLNYLHLVGLDNSVDCKVSSFSLGMKQRLGLAQALIHQPTILLLDEPFNGLDPIGIKEFRDLLIELSKKGVGIVISSHSLEELSKLVDTVTIINQGKVIFQGKKTEFLSIGSIKNVWLLKTDNIELTKSILNNLNIVFSERIEQLELSLDIESMKEVKEKLLTELLRQDISIINFSEKQNNFEDIFIKMQRDMEV